MILLRKILFPLAFLYWLITYIRNWLYDKGIFKSSSFDIPIIAVGNLSVGGTGKTPQIEYLIRLLSDNYKVAVLSRGYKRSTEGFILADENATASSIGDEPFQFYSKFPNIQVAVDANRKNGIENLLQLQDKPDVILLDEPTSALDPISTSKIEDLLMDLKKDYTIVIVTHNMQQATRISDKTVFFLLGEIIEAGKTDELFSMPKDKRTEDYITGRFG